jgi:light-regulated signal transduction histidine kinase (bacteriophytochrome)
MLGSMQDITDRKKAAELLEQKVEDRTRELQQVNNQLKQFTYAASHDLQEPLRKIGFFLDMLMDQIGHGLNEENRSIAVKIQHTANRMRSLIDDLLEYSNTELGVMCFTEVNLNDTVKDVLDDMEATISQKGASINLHELPVVKGDHRHLQQMFQNLISNALKYHKSDRAPNVEIGAQMVKGNDVSAEVPQEKRDATFYLIQIKDNGIGFDPMYAKRIFQLFQRLHGRMEYEGTGVGLSIVQKVVENHRGYIWAKSKPGEGATFSVLLPVE